jgi:hypothetical protein
MVLEYVLATARFAASPTISSVMRGLRCSNISPSRGEWRELEQSRVISVGNRDDSVPEAERNTASSTTSGGVHYLRVDDVYWRPRG